VHRAVVRVAAAQLRKRHPRVVAQRARVEPHGARVVRAPRAAEDEARYRGRRGRRCEGEGREQEREDCEHGAWGVGPWAGWLRRLGADIQQGAGSVPMWNCSRDTCRSSSRLLPSAVPLAGGRSFLYIHTHAHQRAHAYVAPPRSPNPRSAQPAVLAPSQRSLPSPQPRIALCRRNLRLNIC
jgi:hypothetical protein